MASLAPLREAIDGLKESVAEALLSPPEQAVADTKARWLAALDTLRLRAPVYKDHVDKIREALAKLERAFTPSGMSELGLAQATEVLRRAGVDLDVQLVVQRFVLNYTIDTLEESEKSLREILAPTLRDLKEGRGEIFSVGALSPAERARAIAVPEHIEGLLKAALEDFRDTRWRMIARRADLEDPGDAPVFDDPEALIAYLNA
jgi:hypothetical protein